MRNLESLRSLNKETGVFRNPIGFQIQEEPRIAKQPDLPEVSPEDIFILEKPYNEKLFENEHLPKPMLRMVKDSGEVVIDEDLSEKSPKRTAEITIFTAPRLIKRILEQNT